MFGGAWNTLEHPKCSFVQRNGQHPIARSCVSAVLLLIFKGLEKGFYSEPAPDVSSSEQFMSPQKPLPGNLMLEVFPSLGEEESSPFLLLPDLLLSTPLLLLLLLELKTSTQHSPALCQSPGLPPTQSICRSRAWVLFVLVLGTNTPQFQLQTNVWPAKTSLGAATSHQPKQFCSSSWSWRLPCTSQPCSERVFTQRVAKQGWREESWSLNRGVLTTLRS